MLRHGEHLLRGPGDSKVRSLHEVLEGDKVNWWKAKISPTNTLDAMVGDRDSDMGAGWAQGLRCFKVDWNLGLASVIERVLDENDGGDPFDPLR